MYQTELVYKRVAGQTKSEVQITTKPKKVYSDQQWLIVVNSG